MDTDNSRYLVIGAGVNGSVCAAALHNAGVDVTVLARGTRLAELQELGIVIEDPLKNTRSVTRVPVIGALNAADTYDFILVVVRKNQVLELLPVLALNRSPNIVFMGNNVLGPEAYIIALGKERVMLGSVFAGGKRDGSVIRAMRVGGAVSDFGEIDGTVTPRLTRLVGIFNRAGLKAGVSKNITDSITTHAALVAPIATLVIKYGCDTYALARSPANLDLLVSAMRETLSVLRAGGRKVIPMSNAMIGVLPRFMLVALFRWLLASRLGEIGLAWHCTQAPDEVQQLASELLILVEQSGLAVPALRKILGDH